MQKNPPTTTGVFLTCCFLLALLLVVDLADPPPDEVEHLLVVDAHVDAWKVPVAAAPDAPGHEADLDVSRGAPAAAATAAPGLEADEGSAGVARTAADPSELVV